MKQEQLDETVGFYVVQTLTEILDEVESLRVQMKAATVKLDQLDQMVYAMKEALKASSLSPKEGEPE